MDNNMDNKDKASENNKKKRKVREDEDEHVPPPEIDPALRKYLETMFGNMEQKFDKKFDDMEEKFDKKFDDINKRFDNVEERFDKKFDSMKTTIRNMEERFDNMDKKLDLLVSLSPEAVMQHVNPAFVTSSQLEKKAVLEGGESTWSFLKLDDGTLLAVGSVHCGLYYGSMHPTLAFVNLPQMVVNLGVEKIGFLQPNKIQNPIPYKYDVMLVRLKQNKLPDMMSGSPQKYQTLAASSKKKIRRVAGMSNSGIVSGSNVVFNNDGGYYVFVEDFGDIGNSGTLMFGWDGDFNDAKPVGVYNGIFPVGDKKETTSSRPFSFHGNRPRGVIVPLPNLKECTWFEPLLPKKTATDTTGSFPTTCTIFDRKGVRLCNIFHNEDSDPASCFLEDGGVQWPGVLLHFRDENEKIMYCGSMDTGSRRCN
ncbi:hypothetical protein IV203_025373 [Nitzschia inconspicua]|uniref:Uncharacterized protein n=1 Tax=Nitzschia inconspicua TaxID=303405 RepID=A0A9K3KA71_9STRA|nr:hypothetical protein IV203_024820 [Nitzschia inconspicua]KAG7362489.1 hypothetical protein IV203_025373 [Nitzschia inconspicua]